MKKQILLLLTTILSLHCYSQITFEKGYYINNANQKIDCLIKNIDWKNNPTAFEYKLSENGKKQKANIKSVKEFSVDRSSKYIRSTVNIDRSSKYVNKLSNDKKPIFKEEDIFLKVLVEGKANLYLFEDGNLKRYFYNKENTTIEQLIYKLYRTLNNKILTNNSYKYQLWDDLKCSNFKIKKLDNLEYKKNDLIDFFVEYHECNGEEYINYEDKQKRDLFNLSLRPGLNNSTLSIQNNVSSSIDTDFSNEVAFRFGVEAEFIMPFNKNKWSLIMEPTYQYFKSKANTSTQSVVADYKSIELPIGLRHYFFFNEDSKIFINGSFIFDWSNNSEIDFESTTDFKIKTRSNLAFGFGYKYNNRYSLELRYQTAREILGDYLFMRSDYQTLSVILGYSLF